MELCCKLIKYINWSLGHGSVEKEKKQDMIYFSNTQAATPCLMEVISCIIATYHEQFLSSSIMPMLHFLDTDFQASIR